jgi:uncharacterized protein (DUF2147 family)
MWTKAALAGLVLLFAALAPRPGLAADAPILGRWLTEPRDGIIEITRLADGSFQGLIIGGNAPKRLDANNPDPARRQQLLLGQIILKGLREDGAAWAGGTIYDPDSGHTYKCRIELLDRDHIKVRGFLGISLLGRSQTWSRYLGSTLDLSAAAH